MTRKILRKTEAHSEIQKGLEELLAAVGVTLGPAGKTVVIQQTMRPPHVTKDGVTVASQVYLEDPIQNDAVQVVIQAARKLADVAGDGTTTATVLACNLYKHLSLFIEKSKSPMFGGFGKNKTVNVNKVVDHLKHLSKIVLSEIESQKTSLQGRQLQIARISSNQDEAVAQLVREAYQMAGDDGLVLIDESPSSESTVELRESYHYEGIDKGLIHPVFVNDHKTVSFRSEKAYVLLVDEIVQNVEDLKLFFENFIKNGQYTSHPLIILGNNFQGTFLRTIMDWKQKGNLQVILAKTPSFGDKRKNMMQDIAQYIGGGYINATQGTPIKQATTAQLGYVDSAVITRNSVTLIRHDKDQNQDVQTKLQMLAGQIEGIAGDGTLKQELQERFRALNAKAAIIYCGAPTEVAMKEKKDRADDAVRAVKAASQGIVPGGGVVLYSIGIKLLNQRNGYKEQEYQIASKALANALMEPMKLIVSNAGEEIPEELLQGEHPPIHWGKGYDARKREIANMLEIGIIDPVIVAKEAVTTAIDCASTLISVGIAMPYTNKTGLS